MADDEVDLKTFFLDSIPSRFNQAQRNLHCDDINWLEYMERRLDDYIYVIRAVTDHCLQVRVGEELIELLRICLHVKSSLCTKRSRSSVLCTEISTRNWDLCAQLNNLNVLADRYQRERLLVCTILGSLNKQRRRRQRERHRTKGSMTLKCYYDQIFPLELLAVSHGIP